MKIKRFNEDKGKEFIEEVRDIFSYVLDEYSLDISSGEADSEESTHYVTYVSIKGTMQDYNRDAYDDIISYTKHKKNDISMLDDIIDCLKRMSIESPVYHCFIENKEGFFLEIARERFADSNLFKYNE